MKRHFMCVPLVLALAGCASGYQQFYKPVNGATPQLIASMRAGPAPAEPLVERSQPRNDPALVEAYAKRGYSPIGYSSFSSGKAESEDAAIRQGKEVGADLVLIFDPRFAGSTTTNVPVVLPSSATAHTVTPYGSATTTVYGTTTNIIPVTVNRSNYGALYFVKMHFALGVNTRELNDEERRTLQTNKGVVIRTVVDGTPAYEADLLVGDIITAIDGQPVGTTRNFQELLNARKGKTVAFTLIRGGKTMEKSVGLGT